MDREVVEKRVTFSVGPTRERDFFFARRWRVDSDIRHQAFFFCKWAGGGKRGRGGEISACITPPLSDLAKWAQKWGGRGGGKKVPGRQPPPGGLPFKEVGPCSSSSSSSSSESPCDWLCD